MTDTQKPAQDADSGEMNFGDPSIPAATPQAGITVTKPLVDDPSNSEGSTQPGTFKGGDRGPNEPGATPQREPGPTARAGFKFKWLDNAYVFKGTHYGPSKHWDDFVEVPEAFPDHLGGQRPSPSEFVPAPKSSITFDSEVGGTTANVP